MKKAFFKKATAAVCAAATITALCFSASAKIFDPVNDSFFEGYAPSTENSYIDLTMPAGETTGLAVLKSRYERYRDKYSLTTHYACPYNSSSYRLAYAYVCNESDTFLEGDYNHSDQEDSIVAYVSLYNKNFNKKIVYTKSVGCCSMNQYLPLPEHAYNQMEGRIRFNDM